MDANKFNILKEKVYKGASLKFSLIDDIILDRLSQELKIIDELNLSEYYVVYSKIIDICNRKGYLRTPGRGSASGSLVNYCLDITKNNPIENDLIFERFLNISLRNKIDLHIDISKGCKESLIKDLELELSEYKIARILFKPKNKEEDSEIKNTDIEEYGVHRSALLISDNLSKLEIEEITMNGYQYLKFNDNDAQYEKVFHCRYDILDSDYLSKLMIISNNLDVTFHPYNIKLNDSAVFDLLSSGDLDNILHFNYDSIVKIFRKFNPSSLNDLSVIYAQFKPTALHVIPDLIQNKLYGYDDIFYRDVRIDNILSETYGILVYQESYMHIVNQIAGMDMNTADRYRRLLVKNVLQENKEQFRKEFLDGCYKNSNLSGLEIEKLYEMIISALPRSYIKSHSISYSTVSYWAAYYKTHFRELFTESFN